VGSGRREACAVGTLGPDIGDFGVGDVGGGFVRGGALGRNLGAP
jgi:hypothetical protein